MAVILAVMLAGTAFSLISPYVSTKLLFDDVLTEGGKYYGAVLGVVFVIFLVRFIGVAPQHAVFLRAGAHGTLDRIRT